MEQEIGVITQMGFLAYFLIVWDLVRYARENNIPFLGICLGFQTAVLEYARNVLGLEGANSTEFLPDAEHALISELPDQKKHRFMDDYGLSLYDASVLIAEQQRAQYYEDVANDNDAKLAANWVINELLGILNKNEKTINFDIAYKKTEWKKLEFFSDVRVNEDIYAIFKKHLEINKDIFIFGEDIEFPYGGAFKVTKGLSTKFKNRVLTTPISEASIIGFSAGLALSQKKVIAEIMFGDFLTLCADQIINNASKFRWMYNEQITIPIVIRTPMGGGRGYGPTHSQSLEKFLINCMLFLSFSCIFLHFLSFSSDFPLIFL